MDCAACLVGRVHDLLHANGALAASRLDTPAHPSPLCRQPARPRPGVPDTWDNLYSFFINRVRDRLHMVLCFSPVGKKFARWAQQVGGVGWWVGGMAGWSAGRCALGRCATPGADPDLFWGRSAVPQFPGLINGCTIDWYLPWPEEALTAVSSKFLDSFAIECAPEVSR